MPNLIDHLNDLFIGEVSSAETVGRVSTVATQLVSQAANRPVTVRAFLDTSERLVISMSEKDITREEALVIDERIGKEVSRGLRDRP